MKLRYLKSYSPLLHLPWVSSATNFLAYKLASLFHAELIDATLTGALDLDLYMLIVNIARLWLPDTQETGALKFLTY